MGGWGLVAAATGAWLGILLAGLSPQGHAESSALALLLAGVAAVVALVRSGGRLRRWALLVLLTASFGLIGGGWWILRDARVRGSPLVTLAGHVVAVTGSVSSPPEEHMTGWSASLSATAVRSRVSPASAFAIHDSVWLEGRGAPPRIGPGEAVVLQGTVVALHGDFGAYLRHRGYPARLFVEQVLSRAPPRSLLIRWAEALRSTLRTSLNRIFPRTEAGLVMGLTLGDTSQLDPVIDERFRATGLSHLTAVSGENLAMFLAPILGLAMILKLGRWARFIIGALAIAFFVMLTRAEPSVLRAAAMAGFATLGIFLGRPRSPPAILGGAILVLLTVNPTLVYSIGFQLSVGATAGMAAMATPMADRLRFLPRGLALATGTTLAAQAGVTPLLLYHFGVVPTVTLPANLLAFPAVSPAMLLGLLAAAVGLVLPGAGLMIATLASQPLRYLEWLVATLSRSPLPWITTVPGHLATLAVGVAIVVGLAWALRRGVRLPRRAIVAVAVFVPAFVWLTALRAGPPGALTVTFFDVGQGDGALIRSAGGAAILIDGGPDADEVAMKLSALGVRHLDLMVATHPHADHVAGLPAVLARVPVGLVLDPGCGGDSPYYTAFLHAVRVAGIPIRRPLVGTALRVGDVRLDVLGPEHCYVGTDSDPNNDSIVLRVSAGPDVVLFPGDAERESQTEIIRDELPSLTALVLKVPHHGGDTSLPEFFAATHARVAIVSVGPNRYGHPVPSVLQRLAADGMLVVRTDQHGDVTVTFRGTDVLVSSQR